jgi:diguanylate cyclase (GGDEF)-like protein
MEFSLSRDERIYILSRIPLLLGIAGLVFSGVLKLPIDRVSVAFFALLWIILSTAVGFQFFSRFTVFALHALDMAMLGFVSWKNGGNACPVTYLIPLFPITAAVFIGKDFAALFSVASVAINLFLFGDVTKIRLVDAAYWVIYSAGALSFSFYLATVKEIWNLRLMHSETEKREKALERAISKLEDKLSSQSMTDEATGLKNFRYFRERVDTEMKRANRQKTMFSLCVMSVEGLERYKEKESTERDVALARITRQLEQTLRDTDLISRFQANQFVFLLMDTDPKKSLIPARRLRDKLTNIAFGRNKIDRFEFSFGIAGFPADAQSVGSLISLASAALERSHQRGASQITLASSVARNLTGGK